MNFSAQGTIAATTNISHSICLSDSTLWTWGDGLIGHDNPIYLEPSFVWANSNGGTLNGVISTSAFHSHRIAALSNGTVWTWGSNAQGQLGDGSMVDQSNYPIQMKGEYGDAYIDSITQVSCGYYHSVMLRSDSTVWTCGDNDAGQLGTSSTQDSDVPVGVKGPNGIGSLSDIIQIDAGSHSSIALRSDGTVWAWGSGVYGTMGSGSNDNLYPEQVPIIPQIQKISLKGAHVLALDLEGKIWSWGQNSIGQIGNNTLEHVYSPVLVLDPTGNTVFDNIIDIGTGMLHSFAIDNQGVSYSWGANNEGQLGHGTMAPSFLPKKIVGPSGNGFLEEIIELEGGHLSSIARKSDGTIYCWGEYFTIFPEVIDGTECSPAVGIYEPENGNDTVMKIYPNPSENNSYLTVQIGGDQHSLEKYSIFSVEGRFVSSGPIDNTKLIQIGIEDLNPGVYVLQLNSSSSQDFELFVIQ